MKSSRYSKTALRRTLLFCVATVIGCAVAVGFASSRRAAALQRVEFAEQRIHSARSRLDVAQEHLALIDRYADRYAQLVREGLLAHFDRAVAGDWFEAAIHAGLGAAVSDYTIGKDSVYAGPEVAGLTAFRVVAHRLEFGATASDEDEFDALMRSIERHVPGTTAQEGCSLDRARLSADADVLIAHCALVWYEFAPSNTELVADQTGSGS